MARLELSLLETFYHILHNLKRCPQFATFAYGAEDMRHKFFFAVQVQGMNDRRIDV